MNNSGWQPFGNLEENNPPVENNNFNNLLLSLPVNLFENIGGFNLLSNNNNNPLSEGLDSNVMILVNALIGMNLTRGYYPREESFIKLIKFGKTETENLNEWLEKFNKIAKANQ